MEGFHGPLWKLGKQPQAAETMTVAQHQIHLFSFLTFLPAHHPCKSRGLQSWGIRGVFESDHCLRSHAVHCALNFTSP